MPENELSELELSKLYKSMSIPSLEPSSGTEKTIIVDANCINFEGTPEAVQQSQTILKLLAELRNTQGFQVIIATDNVAAFREGLSNIAIVSPDGLVRLTDQHSSIGDVRNWDGLQVGFAHAIITDEPPQFKGFLTPNHFLMLSPDDVLKYGIQPVTSQILSVYQTAQDKQILGNFSLAEDAFETWDAITELQPFQDMQAFFRIAENNMYFQQTTSDSTISPEMSRPGILAEEALYQYFLAFNHKLIASSNDADASIIACNRTLNRIVEYFPLEAQSQFSKAFADVKLKIEEYAESYANNMRPQISAPDKPPSQPPDAEPC